jgi:hypothetical protein
VPIEINPPSVQSLFLQALFREQVLSSATGFFFSHGGSSHLITSRHVVTGVRQDDGTCLGKDKGVPNRLRVWIFRRIDEGGTQWAPVTVPLYISGAPNWLEHRQLGTRADIVAIPVVPMPPLKVFPYNLTEHLAPIAVHPGKMVSVVGFPFGKAAGGRLPIWSSGFVATELDVDYDDLPVFLIDCRARTGQSGSPVVSYLPGGPALLEDGFTRLFDGPAVRFLGAYSGRINPESDLGMVWKATAIAELVGDGVPARPPHHFIPE